MIWFTLKIIGYIAVVSLVSTILWYFRDHIGFIYKLVGIIISISGAIVGGWSLYLNFLKPAKPIFVIGDKVLLIWHDVALGSNPMLDVFCTTANSGAKHLVVDSIEAELVDSRNNKMMLSDYLFLKTQNDSAYNPTINNWVKTSAFVLDEYSHPFIVGKFSERSTMIGFRIKSPQFLFSEGKYKLTTKLMKDGKDIASDRIAFSLSAQNLEQINIKKQRAQNEYVEINTIESFEE